RDRDRQPIASLGIGVRGDAIADRRRAPDQLAAAVRVWVLAADEAADLVEVAIVEARRRADGLDLATAGRDHPVVDRATAGAVVAQRRIGAQPVERDHGLAGQLA